MARPTGTEQERFALPPWVPARNQMSSGWFSEHEEPSGSSMGLRAGSTDSDHCHQRAGRSPYVAAGVLCVLDALVGVGVAEGCATGAEPVLVQAVRSAAPHAAAAGRRKPNHH